MHHGGKRKSPAADAAERTLSHSGRVPVFFCSGAASEQDRIDPLRITDKTTRGVYKKFTERFWTEANFSVSNKWNTLMGSVAFFQDNQFFEWFFAAAVNTIEPISSRCQRQREFFVSLWRKAHSAPHQNWAVFSPNAVKSGQVNDFKLFARLLLYGKLWQFFFNRFIVVHFAQIHRTLPSMHCHKWRIFCPSPKRWNFRNFLKNQISLIIKKIKIAF